MGPLDPENAPFRCWEHEDCLEHPDLAIVCAGGTRAAALAMFDIYVYDGAFEDVSGDVLHPGGGTGDGYGSSGGGGDSSSVGRYFPYPAVTPASAATARIVVALPAPCSA